MKLIKILSYNIAWEAMTGFKNIAWAWTKCDSDIDKNICLQNVVKYINDNQPYDFVGLQEATNYQEIINRTGLKTMKLLAYKSKNEEMVLFWDGNKYTLDEDKTVIDDLNQPGRPFIMTFFKEGLCVINLHAGHKYNNYPADITNYILNKIDNHPNGEEIKELLNKSNIIMMGDFNSNLISTIPDNNLDDAMEFFGKQMYGKNTAKTCCDKNLNGNVTQPYDHILTTTPNIKTHVCKVLNASDHFPILGFVQFNQKGGYNSTFNTGNTNFENNLLNFAKNAKYGKKIKKQIMELDKMIDNNAKIDAIIMKQLDLIYKIK